MCYSSLEFTKKKKTFTPPAPRAALADTHGHMGSFRETTPHHVLVRASLAGVRKLVVPYDPIGDGRSPLDFARRLESWVDAARHAMRSALEDGAVPAQPRVSRGQEELMADPFALFDNIGILVGVHPYGAAAYSDEVHALMKEALGHPLYRGVGEFGLDYHVDAEDMPDPVSREVQMRVMARQLELACQAGVPAELHLRHEAGDEERISHRDALAVIDEVGVPSAGLILHCFGEDTATMREFLDRGCSIAFGGAATFKRNEEVREAFCACPLDRLLFETDCPYMAPEPVRGLQCEPAMIAWTVDALCLARADVTGEIPEDIALAAWNNAVNML